MRTSTVPSAKNLKNLHTAAQQSMGIRAPLRRFRGDTDVCAEIQMYHRGAGSGCCTPYRLLSSSRAHGRVRGLVYAAGGAMLCCVDSSAVATIPGCNGVGWRAANGWEEGTG